MDKGFTFVGVATDEEGKSVVQPFVQTTNFDVNGHPTLDNHPIVLGGDDIEAKFGGLLGLPTSIVISRGRENSEEVHRDCESRVAGERYSGAAVTAGTLRRRNIGSVG